MTQFVRRILGSILQATRIEVLPVRVRGGVAAGARWTLYPRSAYWRGTHEPELHRALLQLGNLTGRSCWDLGAHFGIYSVGLARRVGPTGHVAAFEPNPVSFRRLVHHAEGNRLSWLKTYPAAASERTGSAELYTYGSMHSTTTHLPYDGEVAQPSAQPISIRTVALDDLVANQEIRLPDLIKVDVEGHAHRALAGARQSLAAKRPVIVVAFHSREEVDGVLSLLRPLGYSGTEIGRPDARTDAMIGKDFLFRSPAAAI